MNLLYTRSQRRIYFNSIKVRLEPRKVLGVDVLRIYGFVGAKIQKNLQKNVDA